jgi:hypothetical protein
MRFAVPLLLASLLALFSAGAGAQFAQYVPPGGLAATQESMPELIQRSMSDARWRLGRFYLSPWIAAHDITYLDNVGGSSGKGKQSDFTATVGAGLRVYRPIGSALTLAAFALPEYAWWQRLEGRRRVNGRYGAGLFADLGRSGFELSAMRTESATFLSRELEEPINVQSDVGSGRAEVHVVGDLSVFAAGTLQRYVFPGNEDTAADVALLERDERVLNGGIAFSLPIGLRVGLGAESSAVDFTSSLRDRSYEGTAPVLELDLEDSLLLLKVRAAARHLRPKDGSSFPPYDRVTGSFLLQLQPTGRTALQGFANRNLVFSLESRWAYFDDTGYGLAVLTSLGSFASVRVYAEQGSNDFTPYVTGGDRRVDDLATVGADLRFRLGRVGLLVGGRRTRYDSNLPSFDRSVTVLRSGISLGSGGASPWG